jgi:uncharacterized membrane protein
MYLGLKFAHVFVAIVALGTSAAVGLMLAFFSDDPTHGEHVLRLVRRLSYSLVVPGYLLMLITGMWMGHKAGLLDARWTESAMNLWGVGAAFLTLMLVGVHRRSRAWARWSAAGWGLVLVAILYFMVIKPI